MCEESELSELSPFVQNPDLAYFVSQQGVSAAVPVEMREESELSELSPLCPKSFVHLACFVLQ
jgi:hypothetical protein